MPIFVTPVHLDNPPIAIDSRGLGARLARHFNPQPVGRSVLLRAGVYVEVVNPDQAELDTLVLGETAFLGGHEFVVSDAVAAALTTDGFGDWIA